MRKKLLLLLLTFGCALAAGAAERHTLSITVSNLPVTGEALGFTAPATKVITWTNTANSTLFVQTNVTRAGCATNLFLQLAAYAPFLPRPTLQWSSPTSFLVQADCEQILTATNSGTWAVLAYDTNDCARLRDVRVPIASERWATSRQEIASLLVAGISSFATNAFDGVRLTNSIGINGTVHRLTNGWYTNSMIDKPWISNGVAQATRITNGVGLNATVYWLTNGVWTNATLDVPILTNGVNYGNAFSSPGPSWAVSAEQFGASAVASNTSATAVGNGAIASGEFSIALGTQARATNSSAVALGVGSIAGFQCIAIGDEAYALTTNSISIGSGSQAAHQHSFAIGHGAITAQDGQGVLGSASVALISAPGRIQAGSVTNGTFTGTNVNKGDWAHEEVSVSTLANGNNIAVAPTNVIMRLIAGPTANFAINGIQNGRSGKILRIHNDTGQQMTLAHESGVDPTPANRIYCTSGGDIVFGTNAVADLHYSAAKSRWIAQINTNAITLANNSVTDGILRDSAALSVIGRAANSTGDPADIAAGANGQVLVRTNSTLIWAIPVFTNDWFSNLNLTGVTNNQLLQYHAASSKWTNVTHRPYQLKVQAGIVGPFSPADSTTYYVGGNPRGNPSTTYSSVQYIAPIAGTVTKAVYAVTVSGTLGTTEDVTLSVRVADTTDSATTAQDWDTAYRSTASADLSVAVAAGDTIAVKIVTPAWVTNPTTVIIDCTIWIE